MKKMPLFFVIYSIFVLVHLSLAAPDIQFDFGTVRGVDKDALGTGSRYYTYFSIPFAESPVGNLRFKPPVPYVGSGRTDEVITSDDYPRACLQQPPLLEGWMSEDCLYLNVFTPPIESQTSAPRKVMVWIHGGAFTMGLTRGYEPGRLVTDHDVIVVSIQYRLGVLGFLSSGDDVLPGNLGLRDQLLALKWIKDNIRRFGGDPDDVTVFGQSAGGASVSLLSLSPQANGLFSKGIMMSGTALAGWVMIRDPETVFIDTARALGCLPRFYFPAFRRLYHATIKSCLERKDATELNYIPPSTEADLYTKSESFLEYYGPVVDGDVIPRNPRDLVRDEGYLRQHGVLDREYVVGFTNQEGLSVVDIVLTTQGATFEQVIEPSNVAALITSITKDDFSLDPTTDVLNMVDFFYTYPRESDGSIPFQGIIDLNNDAAYIVPCIQFAQALADKTSVYLYVFDHYPELKDPEFPVKGTSHAMDLLYLFDYPLEFNEYLSTYANVYTPISQGLPEIYRDLLASFAKSRQPGNVSGLDTLPSSSGDWPKYDVAQQNYLAISTNPEVRRNPYAQRFALWADFMPKLSAQSSYFSKPGRVAYN